MNIETVPIDSISPDPANVRLHPERNIEAIKASLRRFGQQKPIVVDHGGIVRAGNGTLAAAKALGWDEIDVVRTDLEGVDATAFAIADNRTGELAEWDVEALGGILREMDSVMLEDVGFSQEDAEKLAGVFGDVQPLDGLAIMGVRGTNSGEGDIQVWSFTLHKSEAEIVNRAVDERYRQGGVDTSLNANRRGASLAALCQEWMSEWEGRSR